MSAHHVLFVETEGQTLRGHLPGLTGARADWHVVLVSDAETALDVLKQREVCLVVAAFGDDLAGCDAFFLEVQGRASAVIRIGLLPEAHKDKIGTRLDHAHQCLALQCDPVQIKAAIVSGLSVYRRAQENPSLTALIADLHTIPTPPAVYFDIRDELESPHASSQSVAGIIARDPALSAKILKVANSGFYGLPRTIADLHQAITLLGNDTVLGLVLAARLFDRLPVPGLHLDALWMHCVTVATLARQIASEEGGDNRTVSASGVAGLLHDIGGLIFLSHRPGPYATMVRHAGGDEAALLQMERADFGVGHPELGAHVLGLWGLPDVVVEAVALHHDGTQPLGQTTQLPRKAVYVAEWLLQEYTRRDETAQGDEERLLDASQSQVEGWRKVCEQLVENCWPGAA